MTEEAFGRFVAQTREQVDGWLATWLEARMVLARARGPEVAAVAGSLRDLVLRGGKRVRPAMLAAAYVGCGGEGGGAAVVAAGASVELLQGYLLAHDDWMDGDDVRRGGPSVPAMMRARFAAQGDAASVLAGDLGSAWSLEALLEVDRPAACVAAAARALARAHEDVVSGQVLDVLGQATGEQQVELVHALKTGSYTVRAPVAMGALLAGAGPDRVAALTAFAEPLGVAFQLRDDVLGAFGDADVMGKPSGSDLRGGKRTALVVHALRDAHAAPLVLRVLGRAAATDAELGEALHALEESGARAAVEARITALVAEAGAALERAELEPHGRALLAGALRALTRRGK